MLARPRLALKVNTTPPDPRTAQFAKLDEPAQRFLTGPDWCSDHDAPGGAYTSYHG
jgi:hypothetical protein